VATQQKRRTLWKLCRLLVQTYPQVFDEEHHRHEYIFDCGMAFYSLSRVLAGQGEENRQRYPLDITPLVEGDPEAAAYLRPYAEVRAELLETVVLDLRHVDLSPDRSVLQFLDIISSQELIRMHQHLFFKDKIYAAGSRVELQGEPRILKEGMQVGLAGF
jgi:hypothetical protein